MWVNVDNVVNTVDNVNEIRRELHCGSDKSFHSFVGHISHVISRNAIGYVIEICSLKKRVLLVARTSKSIA